MFSLYHYLLIQKQQKVIEYFLFIIAKLYNNRTRCPVNYKARNKQTKKHEELAI